MSGTTAGRSERLLLSTRLALGAGFGGLLAIMALAGAYGIRILQQIRHNEDQIGQQFLLKNHALNDIRFQFHLAGTSVRDYLLEPEPGRAANYMTSLTRERRQMATALESFRQQLEPDQLRYYTELSTQLSNFWQVLGPIFRWDPDQRRREGYAFLRDAVFPRRAAVTEIAARIDVINEQQLEAGNHRVDSLLAEFQRQMAMIVLAALLLGLGMAAFSTWKILGLERRRTPSIKRWWKRASSLSSFPPGWCRCKRMSGANSPVIFMTKSVRRCRRFWWSYVICRRNPRCDAMSSPPATSKRSEAWWRISAGGSQHGAAAAALDAGRSGLGSRPALAGPRSFQAHFHGSERGGGAAVRRSSRRVTRPASTAWSRKRCTTVPRHAHASRVRIRVQQQPGRAGAFHPGRRPGFRCQAEQGAGSAWNPGARGQAGRHMRGTFGARQRNHRGGGIAVQDKWQIGRRRRSEDSEAIRILLADDHNVMRRGLRLLLESQAGFRWWPRPPTAGRRWSRRKRPNLTSWCSISPCRT